MNRILIPICEYEWTDDYSFMRELTCKNHPTARYLTKNPWNRSIHLIAVPTDENIKRTPKNGECTCSFKDLMVVVEEDDNVLD